MPQSDVKTIFAGEIRKFLDLLQIFEVKGSFKYTHIQKTQIHPNDPHTHSNDADLYKVHCKPNNKLVVVESRN